MSKEDKNTDLVIEHEDVPAQELAEHKETAPMVVQSQPDKLLEMAIAKGADLQQIEKFLDLKERYDKEEARKAFTAAFAGFNSEDISIKKDQLVTFDINDGQDTMSYAHASLGNIVKIVVPAMAKHGLATRWDIVQKDARVYVTCIITHAMGHSESVTMDGAPDSSGKKNSIQQVASTTTYLQRYTFLAVTGKAVEEADDDGLGGSAVSKPKSVKIINEEQALKLHSKIIDNGIEMGIFMKWFVSAFKTQGLESIDDLPVEYYDKIDKKIDETIANMKNAEK